MIRLPWTRTWPNEPRSVDDGHVAKRHLFGPQDVLRVVRVKGGPQDGRWSWSSARLKMGRDGVKRFDSRTGYEDTKEAAQLVAEAAYLDG